MDVADEEKFKAGVRRRLTVWQESHPVNTPRHHARPARHGMKRSDWDAVHQHKYDVGLPAVSRVIGSMLKQAGRIFKHHTAF